MITADEITIFKYFLGELAEDEAAEIELLVLKDSDFAEYAQIIEGELIEDYAFGRLTNEQARRFENEYLITDVRLERLNLIKNLSESNSSSKISRQENKAQNVSWLSAWWRKSEPRRLSLALAAIGLLIFCTGTLFIFFTRPSQNAPEKAELTSQGKTTASTSPQISKESQSADSANLTPDLNSNRKNIETQKKAPVAKNNNREITNLPPENRKKLENTTTIAAVTLLPGMLRDNNASVKIVNPGTAQAVKFNLLLEDASVAQYKAELQTAEGKILWKNDKLEAGKGNKTLTLRLPAQILEEKFYLLVVFDASQENQTPVGEYYFKVKRK